MDAVTSVSFPPQLAVAIHAHPYPLLFASLGGVHLYSFPSPDSDWDLRGGHLLPLRGVPGLGKLGETHELACDDGTVELDLITHDAHKLELERNSQISGPSM